jgi:hypothetical protein
MLADVPGKNLEAKVTKIVGDYLAFQIMLSEARAQVERAKASLDQIHDVAKSNRPETCNARMALKFIEDVARVALSHPSTDGAAK